MMPHLNTPWHYRPRLRPAPGGGVPTGVRWDYVEVPDWPNAIDRPDLPISVHRYGVICTERKLTVGECEHFDLELWSKR